MRNVLVTGGAGFIGSHLVRRLRKQGNHVRVLDNLEPQIHGDRADAHFDNDVEFIWADVRDQGSLSDAIQDMDVVVHLAAAVGIGQSMYQIAKYTSVNVGGTANLLDVLANARHGVQKLVIASSATIYGECTCHCSTCGTVYPELRSEDQIKEGKWELLCPRCNEDVRPLPIKEDRPFLGRFIYALNKKAQEQMALSISRAYGIPAVVLRFFNVYGPGQSLRNPYTGAIAVFIARLKGGNHPVIIEDGLQTRDFVSVHDTVLAIELAITKAEANGHVFNVGTGQGTSILGLCHQLQNLYETGVTPQINRTFRKGDVRHSVADISRIQSVLGWSPKVTLEEGLREVLIWSQDQPVEDRFDQAWEEMCTRKLVQTAS